MMQLGPQHRGLLEAVQHELDRARRRHGGRLGLGEPPPMRSSSIKRDSSSCNTCSLRPRAARSADRGAAARSADEPGTPVMRFDEALAERRSRAGRRRRLTTIDRPDSCGTCSRGWPRSNARHDRAFQGSSTRPSGAGFASRPLHHLGGVTGPGRS